MPLKQQRAIAAQLMKCGVSRVRFSSESDVAEALTREDIRKLIRGGVIYKLQKKGTSRGHAREILRQKKRGRRRGAGSVKGKQGSRAPSKRQWIKTTRTLRRTLADFRQSGRMTRQDYRKLYGKVKGGAFRSRKHLLLHLREEEILKTTAEKAAKPEPAVKSRTSQNRTRKTE